MAKSVNYHNVTFLPENKIIQVAHLTSIFETIQVHNPIFESADELNPHNIELKFSCGAEGICRKCKIRAFEKMGPLTPTELGCLTEEELAKGIRLACQARVIQDTRVEIIYKLPFTIRLVDEPVGEHVELNPRIVKEFVSVPESGKPLREALLAAISAHSGRGSGSEIEPARLEAELARRFAVHFQKDHTEATAVCIEGRLVCLEEGDTSRSCYAVAVDLGTNTIVASLVDLVSGNKIAVVTDANPQIELGHDFESRIEMVAEDDLNLEILNEEILLRIDILIQELCRVRDISPLHVYEIAVSGSTGMLHLFLTCAPGLLEQHADGRYQAKQLEIHAPEQAAVYAMPVLSTFAGADITAGIMATRLHRVTETVLLLDLGTTSKAVLHHRGRLYAIGLADTPAFDGAGILFGRSPETGSIDHVRIDGDLQITVVGESLPRGISGGGLIELAGELRRTGLLDDCGRLSGAAVPAADRILEIKKDRAFLLYRDDGEFETDIYVTQADIGLLLQAKTAAGAMVNRLLDHAGIGAYALDKVLLGGPFGEKLQVQAFFDLGLFPGVLQGRVACVGNTVKKGTQMALIDRNVLQEAERLIHKVETLPFDNDSLPGDPPLFDPLF